MTMTKIVKNLKEAIPAQRFTELRNLTISLELGNFCCTMLGWGYFKPVWWRNYLHTHSYFEVCYAYQGQGIFRIEGKNFPVEAGQLFVARPGQPHEIISSEEAPLGIYFWSYTLLADGQARLNARGPDALLENFIESRTPVGTPSESVQAVLQMLTEEIVSKEPGYVQVINGLLSKLILDTARVVSQNSSLAEVTANVGQTRSKNLVQQLITFLSDNYNRPLTLETIARQLNLSERQVSRLFKEQMGLTIMEYLNRLRLEAACQLLMQAKLSIKEIAEATGFQDVRYFMTAFRKYTGKTPGAYRNSNGTKFIEKSES